MGKLLNFFKNNILKIGISFLLIFIPLYPKLPSVHITHTWVYVRFEDFFILLVVAIWLLQLIIKKIKLPPKIWIIFGFYWFAGLLSLVYSLIFIAPSLANFFPSVAVLYFIRHIEYLILFFVAFSTIKSKSDLRDYLIIISLTVLAFSIYALGQRYYIDLWTAFPKFFVRFSYCFPSFQTGNEEFAKGIALCLPKDARITSTFAGHYDLAAYLVLVIPIFTALIFVVKKKIHKILAFLLTFLSIIVLIFTASRVSFVAYLLGITVTLWFLGKRKFIILFYILSIFLLLFFSGSTAKRFMETFRFTSVVVNNQGQVIGQLPAELKNKVSDTISANVPTQNLPVGSGYLGLPQIKDLQKTDKAQIQSALSIERARKLKLENGGVEISTVSGSFLVKKVLVYDISFTTRFQAEWPNAWNAFLRNILLGSGYATVTLAADNNYLRILGETGLLGITSFLLIFFILYQILKQVFPKVPDNLSKAYLLGVAGGVAGLFFNSILIDVFEASKPAETLWIILGIAAGVAFLYKKDFEYKKYILNIITSHKFIVLYLFFMLLLFFLKSVGNFFVADDFTWLKWAATTNLFDLPKLFTDSQGFFFRPLDKVLMYFLYTAFSFTPNGYHIFMLLNHFLIGVGVYLLCQKLFKNKILSGIGAFIFLFLPSQGENLYWISTISTNISTLFIIYLLLLWSKFRESKSKFLYVICLFLAFFSLLSYEGSIIFLPLIVLFDYFVTKTKILKDKTILSYLPFAIFSAFYPLIRELTHSVNFGGDYSYNILHLIPNFFGNFFGYFGLFLIGEPILSYYIQLRDILRQQAILIGAFLAIILVLVILISFAKKQKIKKYWENKDFRILVFSILFSFVSLIPFLGLGNISERYSYLASMGFAIFSVALIKIFTGFIKSEKLKIGIIILITIGIGSWYYYQQNLENSQWREAGRITQRTLAYLRLYYDGNHPNSNFYFIDVPIRREQAWIFPVGLDDGIWFIYRDKSIRIYKLSSLAQGKILSKVKNNFVFSFDKNNNIYAIK